MRTREIDEVDIQCIIIDNAKKNIVPNGVLITLSITPNDVSISVI